MTQNRPWRAAQLGLILPMLALSSGLWGQSETTSAITGQVMDQSGGAVAGATGQLIRSGAGSVWSNASQPLVDPLYIGSAGTGVLVVSNGATVVDGNAYIGNALGANGDAALVTGAGSRWSNGGSLYIGVSGSGNTLLITNGGTVIATNVLIC